MGISRKQTLKYFLLPGVIPRLGRFFSSGFSHVALHMACVFGAVRLLPRGHPYLSPANVSRFGIRHVLAEARRNLVFSRANIDQVIIYYTLLGGIFLLFVQFAMLGLSFTMQAAHATIITPADTMARFGVASMLSTPDATNDVAFVLLDYVFGAQGIFTNPGGVGTCLATNTPCFTGTTAYGAWPTPWHTALHTLFRFYNLGVLAVGIIVFLYLVASVTAETAQSGTPFGQRFNRTWAPVRLILAIALLVMIPFGTGGQTGFNIAQVITLHVAKWGSGLATNGWATFNRSLNNSATSPMGPPANLVARPNPPQFNTFLEFMYVAHTCVMAEQWTNNRNIQFFQVRDAIPARYNPATGIQTAPAVPAAAQPVPADFQTALAFSYGGNIDVRIGEYNPTLYQLEKGYVKPVCGEFRLPLKVQSCPNDSPGACMLHERYYGIMRDMALNDPLYQLDGFQMASRTTPTDNRNPQIPIPTADDFRIDYIDYYDEEIALAIDDARMAQIADPNWFSATVQYGWGGAGIWYNRVSQYNGTFAAAAYSLPVALSYPEVMVNVAKERGKTLNFVPPNERYNPSLPGGKMVKFESPGDAYIAIALYQAHRAWRDMFEKPKGNFFVDTITALFGLEGLLNMYQNNNIHPMAQMTAMGRSLVETAVTNLGIAFGAGALGGLANIIGYSGVATFSTAVSGMMGQIGLAALGMGFVLAYIIPMMPFLYFFFAVGVWLKSVFEAMVAMPLWALAHVRIDGDGIPGPAALDGYYLLLEIFIRPFLIVVGLISGLIIFGAQVSVLHEIWQLVVSNATGFDTVSTAAQTGAGYAPPPGAGSGITGALEFKRSPVDEFFFTVMYAIVVYMLGLSSFKLIDLIPDNILRWMSTGVSSFGQIVKDPAENLVSYSFLFTQAVSSKIGSGLQSMQSLVSRNR
jgi:hypothetical protein